MSSITNISHGPPSHRLYYSQEVVNGWRITGLVVAALLAAAALYFQIQTPQAFSHQVLPYSFGAASLLCGGPILIRMIIDGYRRHVIQEIDLSRELSQKNRQANIWDQAGMFERPNKSEQAYLERMKKEGEYRISFDAYTHRVTKKIFNATYLGAHLAPSIQKDIDDRRGADSGRDFIYINGNRIADNTDAFSKVINPAAYQNVCREIEAFAQENGLHPSRLIGLANQSLIKLCDDHLISSRYSMGIDGAYFIAGNKTGTHHNYYQDDSHRTYCESIMILCAKSSETGERLYYIPLRVRINLQTGEGEIRWQVLESDDPAHDPRLDPAKLLTKGAIPIKTKDKSV